MRFWMVLPLVLAVSCTPRVGYRDDPIDIRTLAKPDEVQAPAVAVTPVVVAPQGAAVPASAPSGPMQGGPWRAWVLRQTQPNGDTVEGHYIEIAPVAPALEVIQPAKILPKAPWPQLGAKPQAPPQTGAPIPPPPPPAAHQGPGGLPQGMTYPRFPFPLPHQPAPGGE